MEHLHLQKICPLLIQSQSRYRGNSLLSRNGKWLLAPPYIYWTTCIAYYMILSSTTYTIAIKAQSCSHLIGVYYIAYSHVINITSLANELSCTPLSHTHQLRNYNTLHNTGISLLLQVSHSYPWLQSPNQRLIHHLLSIFHKN